VGSKVGLDMYLYRREYISGWDWNDNPKEMKMYSDILEYTGAERCVGSPHAQVEICVAYWRKANAVHKWFCDLDGGRDECQSIYVTKENLIELRDLAKSVIEQPAMAGDVLPTQQGFFFGSYDYDDWYMEDMKNTVEQIDNILAASGEWSDFIYRASW
jgi:hypothetical protein